MVEMTRATTPPISPAIGPVIRDQIRDLRERSGYSREELAERAREHGAPEKFTAAVVGFLERGRRGLAVDELFALAGAFEVSPLELLGEAAGAFIGGGPSPAGGCPTCDPDEPGRQESVTRADLDKLGSLAVLEPTLVETAIRLAREIDRARGDAVVQLPRLTKELRATIEQIAAGRRVTADPDEDEELDEDDLSSPDD
jgi:transcriptional regulator with XRE-family HTH domain